MRNAGRMDGANAAVNSLAGTTAGHPGAAGRMAIVETSACVIRLPRSAGKNA